MSTSGDRIRALRESLDLSQEALAKKLGISTKTLQTCEYSKGKLESLAKIADFFDVDLNYLRCRTDDPLTPEARKKKEAEERLRMAEERKSNPKLRKATMRVRDWIRQPQYNDAFRHTLRKAISDALDITLEELKHFEALEDVFDYHQVDQLTEVLGLHESYLYGTTDDPITSEVHRKLANEEAAGQD